MSPEIRQAVEDWKSGRAYMGNDRNYRLRQRQIGWKWYGRGPVAPWNRAAKRLSPTTDALHALAFPGE